MLEMLRELLKRTVEVDCFVAQGLAAAERVGEHSQVVLAEADPALAPRPTVAARVARLRTRMRDLFIHGSYWTLSPLSNQRRRDLLQMSSQH